MEWLKKEMKLPLLNKGETVNPGENPMVGGTRHNSPIQKAFSIHCAYIQQSHYLASLKLMAEDFSRPTLLFHEIGKFVERRRSFSKTVA